MQKTVRVKITLPHTLRVLRIQAGKSCAEVAEALGVTERAVHKYEHGDREISLAQVVTLAKVYDVTIEDIVYAQLNSLSAR